MKLLVRHALREVVRIAGRGEAGAGTSVMDAMIDEGDEGSGARVAYRGARGDRAKPFGPPLTKMAAMSATRDAKKTTVVTERLKSLSLWGCMLSNRMLQLEFWGARRPSHVHSNTRKWRLCPDVAVNSAPARVRYDGRPHRKRQLV